VAEKGERSVLQNKRGKDLALGVLRAERLLL